MNLSLRGSCRYKAGLEPSFYTFAKGSFTTNVSTHVLRVVKEPLAKREGVAGIKQGLKPLFYTFAKGSFTTRVSTHLLTLVVKELLGQVHLLLHKMIFL